MGIFAPEKGIACCGLACCVCSENERCPGCRQEGCPDKETCRHLICCREKGLDGCWACPEFPCGQPLFQKPRVRAFCTLAARYGTEHLICRLGEQAAQGVQYHWPGQLIGDYDVPQEEAGICAMIFEDAEAEEGPIGRP